MNLIDTMLRARRQRRNIEVLRQLDERLLRDIGLDRYAFNAMVVGRDIGRLQDLGR
jgi:uncharacterized protein YjiS (DUF1127 family)